MMTQHTTSKQPVAASSRGGGLSAPVIDRPRRGFTLDILDKQRNGEAVLLTLYANASVNWNPFAGWDWGGCPDLWILAGDGAGVVGHTRSRGIPGTACTDTVQMHLDPAANLKTITFFVYDGDQPLSEVREHLDDYQAMSATLDLSAPAEHLRDTGVASDPEQTRSWGFSGAGAGLVDLTENAATVALVGAGAAGLYLAWPLLSKLRDAATQSTEESNVQQS